jgi:hypothetical protein
MHCNTPFLSMSTPARLAQHPGTRQTQDGTDRIPAAVEKYVEDILVDERRDEGGILKLQACHSPSLGVNRASHFLMRHSVGET